MTPSGNLLRKSYFLGTKIRNLRKSNHLTMEDLSARCMRINAEAAPSVSYLSMIERGKRVPSREIIEVIASVFQNQPGWFLDDAPEETAIAPAKGSRGGVFGMPLEPGFLFSSEILQIAIPEMLTQTGTTGRQFAQLLIRAHQEHHQNHFPDLERAAEEVGLKRLPLDLEDIMAITRQHGLEIKWFDKIPAEIAQANSCNPDGLVSSFFTPPATIYVNEILKSYPKRLKYDLSVHIGHCVLHDKDGLKSVLIAGSNQPENNSAGYPDGNCSSDVNPQEILYAWRDFECSFFAGALLCPKVPFRQLLDRHGNEVSVSKYADTSTSVAMRRMTAVSPYPHWHYFDAYAAGKFKAVYRGNGIPLPWGNMRAVEDPCQHWSVFRKLNNPAPGTSAQISILNVGDEPRIYCCESTRVKDITGTNHVLCAGIDLNPAIEAQGLDSLSLAAELKNTCVEQGGFTAIPKKIKADLTRVARILNIAWIERGIESDARLICSRGAICPREQSCYKPDNGKSQTSREIRTTDMDGIV